MAGGPGEPDKSSNLQGQMDKMRETVRMFQSQRDAALARARASNGDETRNRGGDADRRGQRDRNNEHKGNKGKGKGKYTNDRREDDNRGKRRR